LDRTVSILVIVISVLFISGIIPVVDEDVDTFVGDNDERMRVAFRTDSGELIIDCAVARTGKEKSRGLMYNTSLPQDEGMVFIYEEPEIVTFWMKNTFLDLDIIFISENHEVLNVAEADSGVEIPDDQLERYSSEGPCQYVIEVNQGISASYGIRPGTKIDLDLSRGA
jgi:hypothetical protein